MRLRINKMHYPVTSLGPGKRIGLWFQGCSLGCPECISRDTWPKRASTSVELDAVLSWCKEQLVNDPDGLTISGGEPFEQSLALSALLDEVVTWRGLLAHPFDVLCYSGLPLKRLQREFPAILDRLDAIVPEPFARSLSQTNIWRGSSNQPLVPLSELGRQRYCEHLDEQFAKAVEIQVQVQAAKIWFIGIPRRGDMQRFEAACRARGIVPGSVSWRA